MIVTAVLTLTLLTAQPDALVQVFSPTQGVTITAPAKDGCNQVDAWWVQCWAQAADGMQIAATWRCNDPQAVIVLRVDEWARVLEMKRCRWQTFAPVIQKE